MDSSMLFLISVIVAMAIGYLAVKRHWKIADLF